MRVILTAVSALAAIAIFPSAANAAVTVNGPIRPGQVFTSSTPPPNTLAPGQTMDFFVSGNPLSGPLTATFGDVGIPTGMFTDLYDFIIPQNGTGSGSVVTSTVDFLGSTDLDFTSVLVNGVAATPTYRDASNAVCTTPGVGTCGVTESFAITGVPIISGAPNEISVSGLSRGNGSYGGNATFIPAVPEPATWAMMLLGFGAIGFSMRNRRRSVLAQIA